MLYEAKLKDEETIRLLLKYCNISEREAINLLQNEKFINAPCRKLEYYLLFEKGYDESATDIYIHNKAIGILTKNVELSKLTGAQLYEAIEIENR